MPLEKRTRVLLKVSGESLMGDMNYGHDFNTLNNIANDIKEVCLQGIEVCVVVGGGNIYRGSDSKTLGIDRATADHMGMLATVINALALQNTMEKNSVHTRVQSAVPMMSVCEPFVRRKARRHMEKGRVVIFAAGIGNPFFTTDSAAVLRAIEMKCDLLLKGTNVDGVYDDDPKQNPTATRLENVSYNDVLRDNLRVMDMAAIAVAKENSLPIKVFSIKEKGNFLKILRNEGKFTLIK
ncbi:MAG TPA: UMP kinase [Candidatus Megaira endosymbiont of Nemacystus decipiens]|nr:UMP kinase [Candidatus Megaera endosymbiont of Nemacystus decipiens]